MLWVIPMIISCMGILISGYLIGNEELGKKWERRISIIGILSLICCGLSIIGLYYTVALNG